MEKFKHVQFKWKPREEIEYKNWNTKEEERKWCEIEGKRKYKTRVKKKQIEENSDKEKDKVERLRKSK